jgi:hypothetical protein
LLPVVGTAENATERYFWDRGQLNAYRHVPLETPGPGDAADGGGPTAQSIPDGLLKIVPEPESGPTTKASVSQFSILQTATGVEVMMLSAGDA